jgi:DNA polymerase I-like protein with 3'-5' exonuclease and polymerase domains
VSDVSIWNELKRLGTYFCLDTETAMAPQCFQPRQARLIQFHNDTTSLYFDLLAFGDDEWAELGAFLEDPVLEIYGQNLLFDYRVLYANGIRLRGTLFDTMVASNLIHNGRAKMSHSLAEIARRELGKVVDKSLQAGGGATSWMEGELTEARIAYAMGDVITTWECAHVLHEQIEAQGLSDVYALECALIPAVAQMEHHGMYLDPDAISETVEHYSCESQMAKLCFLETLDGRLQDAGAPALPKDDDGTFNTRTKDSGSIRLGTKRFAGFNLNSSSQVLAYWKFLGIEPVDDAKKPTTDRKVLARFQSDELVRMFLHYKRVEKRKGMAQKLTEHCDEDGRIRARFMPLATGTGRFSCVAGNTILITSRGDFRFDEYIPEEGDLVLTHKGRWMPVLRKIYRGAEPMYRVTTEAGSSLVCTSEHKLRTPSGWAQVSSLTPGDYVEYFEELDQQRGQYQSHAGTIQGRGQTFDEGASSGARYYLPQRQACASKPLVKGGVSRREGLALLEVEKGSTESDERQEWFPTPQLQRLSARSAGLFDRAGRERWSGFAAQASNGPSSWAYPIAPEFSRTSHRWQFHEQRLGQLGLGDSKWSQCLAPSETRVVSIDFVGAMGVWDIEVMGDHSYATYGFLNHNCSSPNLQQIPRDPQFRCAFRAPEGRRLVQADYAAMELRVAAAIANERAMIDAFNAGADIHTRTAALMFNLSEAEIKERKELRQQAKAVNFGALYGSSARGVQQYFATLGMFISEKQARELLQLWHAAYPAFGKWHQLCQAKAMKGDPVRTIIGRRRLLFGDENRLTVQANNVVQGTSADITKAALIAIHRALPAMAFLVATVHDEILVECEEADAEGIAEMVIREMEEAAVPMLGKGIRIKAEGGVLTSWGDK